MKAKMTRQKIIKVFENMDTCTYQATVCAVNWVI